MHGSTPLHNGENMQRLIRLSQLASTPTRQGLLPVSPTTIWRWSKTDPNFPKPIKIGKGITAWRLNEIDSWLNDFHSSTKQS